MSNSDTQQSYHYPQAWLLLISLLGFGTYIAWDLKAFSLILSLDRSYMASITLVLVVLATAHCGWHIAHFSIHIVKIQNWLEGERVLHGTDSSFLNNYLADLQTTLPAAMNANHVLPVDDSIVEIQAERVRSPVDLGWFFVDLAVRLGLLGTIIGFILIFSSLSDINIDGGDDLKNLLIAMSGGMGTALLTTLTGLIAASVLSFQYLILGRETEHLVGLLLRVKHLFHSNYVDRSATAKTQPLSETQGQLVEQVIPGTGQT